MLLPHTGNFFRTRSIVNLVRMCYGPRIVIFHTFPKTFYTSSIKFCSHRIRTKSVFIAFSNFLSIFEWFYPYTCLQMAAFLQISHWLEIIVILVVSTKMANNSLNCARARGCASWMDVFLAIALAIIPVFQKPVTPAPLIISFALLKSWTPHASYALKHRVRIQFIVYSL